MRPDVKVIGIGGDKLADAGMELLHHYKEINTIALSEGLGKLGSIIDAYKAMKSEIRSGRHDLFIPVDFPDVNLRLCALARKAGLKVCYYISPQVWAWRKGRIRKIAARVDRMMTIFPFEQTLYRAAGVKADFVGHTMVKDIPPDQDKGRLRIDLGIESGAHVVALVPGSRPAEVTRMLPVMCRAAQTYATRYPGTRFVLPLAGPHLADLVKSILSKQSVSVNVRSEDAAVLMASSDSGLVTSGTATLQAALAGMPHAVAYILDRPTWLFASKVLKPLVMDKDIHVAIANVLSIKHEKEGYGPIQVMLDAGHHIACHECGRPLLIPELLQDNADPARLAEWLIRFKTDQSLRTAMSKGFSMIREMLTQADEALSPAKVVSDCLEN